MKSVGHKKLPQISQIHTDSLSLTQVLHKRFFFKLYGGKENANERKESLLSICRVQLFFCKDTTFPRNFQGFWEKCRDDDNENEGFNIKLPSEIASQK